MQPTVGGLVQKDHPDDRSWYIVPLCKDCNTRTGRDLDVWDLLVLVPVVSAEAGQTRHALPGNALTFLTGQPA